MTKIIAIFNRAGGSCKTTMTLNLGYHLAEANHKVLLVDLDGQASLTRFARQTPAEDHPRIFDVLFGGETVTPFTNTHEMSFVLSDARMDCFDIELGLAQRPDPAFLLQDALKNLEEDYDFILLDCPPSLGMATTNALIACTHVLVPIEPVKKGLEGVTDLFETIQDAENASGVSIQYAGIVPVRYDKRIKASRQYLEILEQFSSQMNVFPAIPSRADFTYAGDQYLPIAVYDPHSDVVDSFREIVQGLEEL